jgi:predicted dehydrogenase
MDKVKVGFIGCGGIAQFHFGHMEKIEEVQVVAACDLIQEKADRTAARFNAKAYTSYKEMFEREQLDAVYVCVEPSAHNGMEMMAIERGINLFVQKPMSLDLAYAKDVRDAIADKGIVSAVGFQCRYVDTLPRVKGWLDGQDIGMAVCTRLGGLPMVWWWRRHEHSGGQVVEQSIHNYDVLRYLLGEVDAVHGMARRGVIRDIENYNTDDASAVTMHFKSGVVATLMSGCFSPNAFGHSSFDFYTRQGVLNYGLGGNFKIRQDNMTIEGKPGNDYGQESDDTFIDAIIEKDPTMVLSPYADAYKSLELTLAINESMAQGGKLVELA